MEDDLRFVLYERPIFVGDAQVLGQNVTSYHLQLVEQLGILCLQPVEYLECLR